MLVTTTAQDLSKHFSFVASLKSAEYGVIHGGDADLGTLLNAAIMMADLGVRERECEASPCVNTHTYALMPVRVLQVMLPRTLPYMSNGLS